jgi:hypothetical protein
MNNFNGIVKNAQDSYFFSVFYNFHSVSEGAAETKPDE